LVTIIKWGKAISPERVEVQFCRYCPSVRVAMTVAKRCWIWCEIAPGGGVCRENRGCLFKAASRIIANENLLKALGDENGGIWGSDIKNRRKKRV
jgi:hypothetical protein